MSEHLHSLTPPPDHSRSVLAVAVGLGVALVVFSFRNYSLPTPGDNIHHLPFGGSYRDGTKSVHYSGPRGGQTTFWAWPIVAIPALSLLIYVLSQRSRDKSGGVHICPCCSYMVELRH
ncbi:TGB2 [Senna mosaic virus]|uniref:TGB2 n=1 Tax=Senna mosaic virus TaxID=1881013 RepID=A0A1B1V3J4_9VIRU|nr:TGB2 [Senna mosaic virus]ANW11494.1 TGB2 [Senna mosaic virus]